MLDRTTLGQCAQCDGSLELVRCRHIGCSFEMRACQRCNAGIVIKHMVTHEAECSWVPRQLPADKVA